MLAEQSQYFYFPEVCILVLKELKALKKQITFSIYNKQIVALIKLIEQRVEEIQQ